VDDNFNDFESIPNLVSMFLSRAELRGDRPFLGYKHGDEWRTISWAETARRVAGLAKALKAMGWKKGDRGMLVSENRPEWCIADMAIMAAGCITVPAYVTNTERDHQHILEDSGASAVIVANEKLSKPLIGALVRTGKARHVIGIEPLRHRPDRPVRISRLGQPADRRCRQGPRRDRQARGQDQARRYRLHHLYQRHRRIPARRDAAPRRDPVQRRWRGPHPG